MELILTPEEQQIQSYYDQIPYHNFEHAIHVTKNALRVANKLKEVLLLTDDDIDKIY